MKSLRKNIYLLFIFSFVFVLNTKNVSAQEDFFEDEILEDSRTENLDEMYDNSDIYENEEGIDDPNGMYELDEITADTFQQITDMERQNALMEIQIRQEKLKLDLEKQRAEQLKLETKLVDDERERQFKQEEQDRKILQERRKQEDEDNKRNEELKKQQQEEELNNTLLEKINSADLSNPEDVNAVAQLMSLVTGKKVSDLGAAKVKQDEEEELELEDKYIIKSIMGVAGNLTANVENVEKKSSLKVKKGFALDGWFVKDIKGSSMILEKDGQIKVMYLN